MILTGKCKEDFLKHTLYTDTTFDLIDELFQTALIIEFFDSVGIRIGISYFNVGLGYFEYRIHYHGAVGTGVTRQQATNEAIKKANLIYNGL